MIFMRELLGGGYLMLPRAAAYDGELDRLHDEAKGPPSRTKPPNTATRTTIRINDKHSQFCALLGPLAFRGPEGPFALRGPVH